jgi:hypothetical protein
MQSIARLIAHGNKKTGNSNELMEEAKIKRLAKRL